MEKIIRGRGTGKTTELLTLCAETGGCIVCSNCKKRTLMKYVCNMDLREKVCVLSYAEFINGKHHGHGFKSVYIDNADMLLSLMNTGVKIKGITMTADDINPIEDVESNWCLLWSGLDDSSKQYQCNKRASLFKRVHSDGTVDYKDNNRCWCIDVNNVKRTYQTGIVENIIDELLPITMPYYPEEPIKVYCEKFLVDSSNGDFDTVGVLYAVKPDGRIIRIDRFFKEMLCGWKKIKSNEYQARKDFADAIAKALEALDEQ